MPRQLRDQAPGYFHVTTRGNNRRDVFLTADDRVVFLSLLRRVAREREWLLQTWCLMTNHFHLVVETRHPNLSAGMQRLNGVYAQWFNAWHSRKDRLFGGDSGPGASRTKRSFGILPSTSSITP
jgi:putative transposase